MKFQVLMVSGRLEAKKNIEADGFTQACVHAQKDLQDVQKSLKLQDVRIKSIKELTR